MGSNASSGVGIGSALVVHIVQASIREPTHESTLAGVNAIYARFPKKPPARIFVCVPAWPF